MVCALGGYFQRYALYKSTFYLLTYLLTYLLICNENPATAVRIPGRATIPLGSNLGQVVSKHCLPSFSAPRNWGTKGSFRRLSGYSD